MQLVVEFRLGSGGIQAGQWWNSGWETPEIAYPDPEARESPREQGLRYNIRSSGFGLFPTLLNLSDMTIVPQAD